MKKSIFIIGLLIVTVYTKTSLAMEPLNRRLPTYDEMLRDQVVGIKATHRIQKINDARKAQKLQPLTFDEEMEIFTELMENSDYNSDEKPV